MQEELPPEDVAPPPMPYFNPYSQQSEYMNENSLRYQLGNEDVIEDIKHTLLGHKKVFSEVTGVEEWIKDENNPGLINKKGMRFIEVFLRGRLNKMFKLTRLDEENIRWMTLECGKNLWDNMVLKHDEWGLTDPAVIKTIVDMVTDTIFATLCAAKDGEYLLFLKTTQRFVESQVLNGQQNNQPQMPAAQPKGLAKIAGLFK